MKFLSTSIFFYFFFILRLGFMAQTYPPGFSEVSLGNIYYPTAMAFAPDGRIFAAEKAGKVKIVKNGQVLSTPFLIIPVSQTDERGLVGIAIDPEFSSNHFVYIFYTTASSPVHSKVSRFTANGDIAVPGSEVVIIDLGPIVNTVHVGGALEFGPDGKLYIGVGNDLVHPYSQNLSNYKGKVLRINKDGSIPPDNPFTGTDVTRRIWAYGLRNPFTISSIMGKVFVNDTGESSWEEINDASTPGRNFGWPTVEGNGNNPSYDDPVYAYSHGSPSLFTGCAISGGTFLDPVSTNYPVQYKGKYFFVDFCGEWINYIDPVTGAVTNFASDLEGNAKDAINVGLDGNLYYFSIVKNLLYKIVYNPTNTIDNYASENEGIKIFPNPSNGKFTIEFSSDNFSNDKINAELVNLVGETVDKKQLDLSRGPSGLKTEWDRSLPAGIYFLKLKAGDASERKIRLVVTQ